MGFPVRATIIDIRTDTPQPEDQLLLDTNVCLWLGWPRASEGQGAAKPYQLTQYPNFIHRAVRAKSQLYHSAISYAEVAHHIERTEFQLANRRHQSLTRKEFRQQRGRDQVAREIHSVWRIIRQLSSPIPTPMDTHATRTVEQLLFALPLGPFDLFLLHALREAGLTGIVTDDMDFSFVPGLTVFTSNLAVINAARDIGRLYHRANMTLPPASVPAEETLQSMPR